MVQTETEAEAETETKLEIEIEIEIATVPQRCSACHLNGFDSLSALAGCYPLLWHRPWGAWK